VLSGDFAKLRNGRTPNGRQDPTLADVSRTSHHASDHLGVGKKFQIVTNVRQASITDEVGLVSLSLSGEREEIKKAISWLEEIGVKVEPVEINTIEG
jgi:transposase